MIGFRVDANPNIALGHMMRCLTIADELKQMGEDVIFIVSDQEADEIVSEKGYEVICLNNSYKDKNSEIGIIKSLLLEYGIERCLVDSYEVDTLYLEELNRVARICYIDDLCSFLAPVAAVVDYTYGASMEQYNCFSYTGKTNIYIGAEYAPIRTQFRQISIAIREKPEAIFLSSGGTDANHIILELCKFFNMTEFTLHVNIVIGSFYEDVEELSELSGANPNITIFQNVSDVASIMKKCDIAISAAGTTLIELAACGIPTIAFSMTEEQKKGIKKREEADILLYAGDIVDNREETIYNLVYMLNELISSKEKRKSLAENAQKVYDGNGAFRVARILRGL